MNSAMFPLEEIIANYTFKGDYVSYDVMNKGHINNTFALNFNDNGAGKTYILQQINTNVFKNPDILMQNYVGVTAFVQQKVKEQGGDEKRESLKVYYTNSDKPYYLDSEGRYWRVINFITDTISYDFPENSELCYKAGKAFGSFQQLLQDYPADKLFETIPNFHNTISRYADFEAALSADKMGRAAEVQTEIEFVKARKEDGSAEVSR